MAIFFLFGLLIITVIISLVGSVILDAHSKVRKELAAKIFLGIWAFLIVLYLILLFVAFINSKMTVDKSDLYGQYVIDKNMFKGKNAKWQYQHFSFQITKDDEFIFYEYSDNGNIKTVHKGEIEFVDSYLSPHLRILNIKPEHQIIESEPLLVREKWHFYYVFKSKKFGNMFFIKKKKGFFNKL